MSKFANFKKEFKELLDKYDASISLNFADCSDTHGMIDEHMVVEFRVNRPKFQYHVHTLSYGYSVDKEDF